MMVNPAQDTGCLFGGADFDRPARVESQRAGLVALLKYPSIPAEASAVRAGVCALRSASAFDTELLRPPMPPEKVQ
jgi:hypothetical protein